MVAYNKHKFTLFPLVNKLLGVGDFCSRVDVLLTALRVVPDVVFYRADEKRGFLADQAELFA